MPHPWILTLAPQRLRNFLENGPSLDLVTGETLAVKGDEMVRPTLATMSPEDDQIQGGTSKREGHHGAQAKAKWEGYGPEPEPDAESAIPTEWHVSLTFQYEATALFQDDALRSSQIASALTQVADCGPSPGRHAPSAEICEEGK